MVADTIRDDLRHISDNLERLFVSIQRVWGIASVRCGRSTARDLRECVTSVWDVVHWPTHEIVLRVVVHSCICCALSSRLQQFLSLPCHVKRNETQHHAHAQHVMTCLMSWSCHAHVFHVNARYRCSCQPVQAGERDLDL